MELWDAYDEHFNKLNIPPLERGKEIPKGVFHLVCEILVKHNDGTYLIMQRDFRKHLGEMWEATAGGSALCGENPIACAKRELLEETGVSSTLLNQVGTEIHIPHQTIYCQFICVTDIKKDDVTLQNGETIAYKWISKEKILLMAENELATKRTLKYVE